MSQLIVTTSWDDGHKLDVRLADLLHKYTIPGTFYVSPKDREFATNELLTDKQIKAISKQFEIGAHTMTHPRLTEITDTESRQEMNDSKRYLESLIGSKVTSFCYPGGNYEKKHAEMAKEAGFTYARTVKRHSDSLIGSMFEASTTVNAYNHYQDLFKIAKFAHFNPFKSMKYFQWDNLAIAMFDKAKADGGVFHLWGHSWEIDKHDDWQKLERVLKHISGHKQVNYVTNSKLPDLQPKKLLIAAPYFPPHLGGVEYYAFHIGQLLKDHYDWDVVAVTTGNRGFQSVRKNYKGLTVYYVPYWFKISNTPFNPMWYFWFRKIIKREQVTVINAHAPVPVFADIMKQAAKQIPVVTTYHMMSMVKGKSGPDRLIKLYEQYILPRTLKSSDFIICSSDKVRDIFLKAYKHKSQTITPGVDLDLFSPSTTQQKNSILFVGSLNKNDQHKGVNFLIDAMKSVVENHPGVKLTIVGQGNGRKAYESTVKSLGLQDNILFAGGKFDKELASIYRNSSIFVLPTLNDSFPLVILEAMASGLPVISTRVGGIPQMIDHNESGYVINPGDSKALADKINYLLENPDVAQQLGSNGRTKAVNGFSWLKQTDKTNTIFLDALHSYREKNT